MGLLIDMTLCSNCQTYFMATSKPQFDRKLCKVCMDNFLLVSENLDKESENEESSKC